MLYMRRPHIARNCPHNQYGKADYGKGGQKGLWKGAKGGESLGQPFWTAYGKHGVEKRKREHTKGKGKTRGVTKSTTKNAYEYYAPPVSYVSPNSFACLGEGCDDSEISEMKSTS